jgi:hypothetical protein
MTLSIVPESAYAECPLCSVPYTLNVIYAESFFMLSVANKPYMPNVDMLSFFMLSVVYAEYHLCSVSFMLSVFFLLRVTNKPFMLSVEMPSVVNAECHLC